MADFDSLLKIGLDERDESWEKAFLRALPEQRVRVASPDPANGPDGWPYLFVETGLAADEPARAPLAWLADRGIGLVVNAGADRPPDYALTYGMVWNFRERGEFLTEAPARASSPLQVKPGQTVFTAAPSESYFPAYARSVLRQFFRDQGLFGPKTLLIGEERDRELDLAFSLESLSSPPEAEHAGILEAISWFLPAHWSIALASERAVPGHWRSL